VQVFLERDERKVLPIPYWTEGEPARKFFNLKRDPGLAKKIRELEGCAELREFVVKVNRRPSRFATLGCDHWIQPSTATGFVQEAGLYVDLVFDRFEAATKRRVLEFFERLRERAAAQPARSKDGGITIIRVQPQRVAFSALGPKTAWMLSIWVFGAGATKAVASSCRARGLALLATLCRLVSRELSAREGDAGTPVPP
jgi:hypothetical protein